MENNNLYKEVKNVIHNDLGITKEYIDEVIKKTVQDEISKLMNDECFIYGLVEKEVMRALHKKDEKSWRTLHDASTFISDEINSEILNIIKDKLIIKFKDEDEGNYDINDFEPVKDEKSGHYIIKHKVGLEGDGDND